MSVPAALNGQCHYYLTRKRRYCRFQPKEGHQYCPEHACMMGIHGKRKRIPCPLTPKHNCYEDELEKHVKKCNVTRSQKATQEAAYYIEGINKAPGTSQPGELSTEKKKVCVKDLTSEELAALIARVDKLYEDHVDPIETAVLEHPCVRDEYGGHEENNLVTVLEDQAALRKELLQQASLIGQLQQQGFLNGGHCFVEMGAGKGKLSHWIQKASKDLTNNSYLLIDRSSVRYKMDSFHKQGGAESEFKRIKVDIEDLWLGFVDLVESSKSVVVVGKHLCGGATDMGIRCAVETLTVPETCQHSSSPTSNSNTQLSSDLNKTNLQQNDNQAERAEPEGVPKTCQHSSSPTSNSNTQRSSDLNKTNLQQNDNQAERAEPEGVPKTCQHSSFAKCYSNEQLPADLNSEKPQHNDNLAAEDDPEFSFKPSDLDKVNESCTTAERESSSRTFDGSGDSVTGSSTDNPPQPGPNRTGCEHISNHKIEAHVPEDILCGDDTTYRGDKVMDTKRKESDSVDLPSDQEPPAKTLKLFDREIQHKLPRGIMIALCCHHQCTWDTYIGQEFMSACGISPQEFDLLTRLSSWATCAKVTAKSIRSKNNEKSSSSATFSEQEDLVRPVDQKDIMGADMKAEDHRTVDLMNLDASKTLREQLSVSEREEIGRKCKRIIDTGRLHYLRSKGMKCFLRQYIDEELTPENVVLMAHIPDS